MKLSVKKEFPQKEQGRSDLPDLVMLHGTGANFQMWRPQIDLLKSRGYRCFLPEFRGHGDSDEPGHPTGIEQHLTDLLETLNGLEIRFPAVFIGHSLGAIISLELAQLRPELVAEILSVSMPGRVIPALTAAFKIVMSAPFEKLRGTAIHRRLPWRERTLISTNRFSLEQIVENFSKRNYVDSPLSIRCPVHFCVGRFDPVAPAHYVRKMHKQLPSSTLKIFEWAGHNCMDEHPEQFNAWMLEKLAQARRSELERTFEPSPETI